MRKFILVLFTLLTSLTTFASHWTGEDINYEYTGFGNVYRVQLRIYSTCESSGTGIPTSDNISFSSSCGSFIKSFSQVYIDTVDMFCPGVTTSCTQMNGQYIGLIVAVYSDTVTLNPCNDWIIFHSSSARAGSIMNLQNPSSQDMYVEAFLDNSTEPNSSAFIPNIPLTHVGVGHSNTATIKAIDLELDSIVHKWRQPKGSASSSLSYANGYSFTAPLGTGSAVSIDNANETITLQPLLFGKFTLSTRTEDYRNGVMVGYSTRDWLVESSGMTTAYTPPIHDTATITVDSTCPGKINSINISFVDSNATDSVYMTVFTPPIPGFNFSTTVNNGLAGANAVVSWTTPVNFNPATLPYFYIKYVIKDNACPVNGYTEYAVAVLTDTCNTQSTGSLANNLQESVIAPNPSNGQAQLLFSISQQSDVEVVVTDMTGKKVWQYENRYGAGNNKLMLPANLNSGIYTVQLLKDGQYIKTLKWVRQ